MLIHLTEPTWMEYTSTAILQDLYASLAPMQSMRTTATVVRVEAQNLKMVSEISSQSNLSFSCFPSVPGQHLYWCSYVISIRGAISTVRVKQLACMRKHQDSVRFDF